MDLIGVTQIAELMGMTRAGAHKLIGRETTFPEPVSVVANRRLWRREEVEAWVASRPISLENAQRMEGPRPAVTPKPDVRPGGVSAAAMRPKPDRFRRGR